MFAKSPFGRENRPPLALSRNRIAGSLQLTWNYDPAPAARPPRQSTRMRPLTSVFGPLRQLAVTLQLGRFRERSGHSASRALAKPGSGTATPTGTGQRRAGRKSQRHALGPGAVPLAPWASRTRRLATRPNGRLPPHGATCWCVCRPCRTPTAPQARAHHGVAQRLACARTPDTLSEQNRNKVLDTKTLRNTFCC